MYSIEDYNFGINSDCEVLQKLRAHFNPHLEIIDYKFSLYDYECENLLIELKSRKCSKDFYDSTIIGCKKLIDAANKQSLRSDLKIYFVFRFIDCITYWEFSSIKMKTLKIQTGGRSDRGRKEQGLYFHIPNKDLINF